MNEFEQRLHAMIIGAQTAHERNLLLNVRNLYDAYGHAASSSSWDDTNDRTPDEAREKGLMPNPPAMSNSAGSFAKDWSNLPANEMTAHNGQIADSELLLTERLEHAETLRKLSRLIEERDLWMAVAEQQRTKAEAAESKILDIARDYETELLNLRGASINDLIAFGNSNVSELERRLQAAEKEIRQLKSALYFAAGR